MIGFGCKRKAVKGHDYGSIRTEMAKDIPSSLIFQFSSDRDFKNVSAALAIKSLVHAQNMHITSHY